MTNLRNELPIAVHVASGGDARVRIGGQKLSFDGVSSVSTQISGATRFRGFLNARTTGGAMLLVGYESPLTIHNASWVGNDLAQFSDDVRDGTVVHFTLVSSDDLAPVQGGAQDAVCLSLYG